MAQLCRFTRCVTGTTSVRLVVPRHIICRVQSARTFFKSSARKSSRSKPHLLIFPGTVLAGATGLLYIKQKQESSSSGKVPVHHQLSAGMKKEGLRTFTYEEVSKHDSEETGVWITFKGGVYDITKFTSQHPGGDIIMLAAGQAVDHYWNSYPIHLSSETLELLESMRIGNLDLDSVPKGDDDPVEDQWINEPKSRNPALKKNQEKPFNAEPPLPILSSQFYTPNDLFYVRNHMPVPKRIDQKEYRLEVSREGSVSLNLSLEELKKFPEYTISSTVQCAGNRRSQMSAIKQVRGLSWGSAAIGNATWTGVRLCDVINSLDLSEKDLEGVLHVQFEGLDEEPATGSSYGASIPIKTAMDPNSEVLLAYKMNGEELPMDHGYPLRVIVPGTVGARNVKWLSRVVLSNEESHSLWQRRDYKLFPSNITIDNVDFGSSSAIQELPVQSAICSPVSGTTINSSDGVLTVKGYAYSGGGRAVTRVDVSVDGGKSWQSAELESDPNQQVGQAWSWSLWETKVPITSSQKGKLNICCRAFDSSCNTQPENAETIWNFRGLCNNSWHHIAVNIS